MYIKTKIKLMTKSSDRNKKKINSTYQLAYVTQTHTTVTQYGSVHHNMSTAVKRNLPKTDIHLILAARKSAFPDQFWL